MYKTSGGSGREPQILIHGDASKTTWLGEMIFDSDGGHFVFDASPCIKNLVGRGGGPRFLYMVTRQRQNGARNGFKS